jgi:hypothetical protein
MPQLTATFEAGVNGNTIATSDPGSANAWNAVTIGAGGTLIYSNTQAAHGTLSARFVSNNNSTRFDWTTASFGTSSDWYGRIYIYFTADPGSSTVRPIDLYDSSDVRCAALLFRVSGPSTVISLRNAALAEVAVGTVGLPLNQWVRIEWHLINSATTGFFEAKMFSTDSTTALDTITSAATINTGTNTGRTRFGDTDGSFLTWWMDDILVGAGSYPGPAGVTPSAADNPPLGMRGRGAGW